MPTPVEERRPAGRPSKITNPHRWHLIVDLKVRDRAARRAARSGQDLTDVLRGLMDDYAAGRIRPTGAPADATPETPEEQ